MSNELFDTSKFPKKDVRRMSWKSIEEYINKKRTDWVLFFLISSESASGEIIISGYGSGEQDNYKLYSDLGGTLDGIGEVWAFCEYPKRLKNFDGKDWSRDE